MTAKSPLGGAQEPADLFSTVTDFGLIARAEHGTKLHPNPKRDAFSERRISAPDSGLVATLDRLIADIQGQDSTDDTRYTIIVALGHRIASRAEELLGVDTSDAASVTVEDLAALSHGYLAALCEVRPMGGELSFYEPASKPGAMKAVRAAAAYFPSDWLADSATNTPMHVLTVATKGGGAMYMPIADPISPPRELTINEVVSAEELDGMVVAMRGPWIYPERFTKLSTRADGRHVYSAQTLNSSYSTEMPGGSGWELVTVDVRATERDAAGASELWVRPNYRAGVRTDFTKRASLTLSPIDSGVPEHGKFMRAGIHELAHRLGESRPQVNAAGVAAVLRRAGGAEPTVRNPFTGNEYYEGGFAHPHVGRKYEGGAHRDDLVRCGGYVHGGVRRASRWCHAFVGCGRRWTP